MNIIIPVLLSFILTYTFPFLLKAIGIDYSSQGAWINLVHIPYITLIPIWVYFLSRKIKRRPARSVLKFTRINSRQVWFIIMLGVGVWSVSQAANSLVDMWLLRLGMNPPVQLSPPQSILDGVLGFIAVCAVTPICEELLYRGVVLSGLERQGHHKAVLISSILFALAHRHPMLYVLGFVYGMFTGYTVALTGSIYAAILLHMVCNFLTFTLRLFSPPEWVLMSIIISGIIMLPVGIWGMVAFRDRPEMSMRNT